MATKKTNPKTSGTFVGEMTGEDWAVAEDPAFDRWMAGLEKDKAAASAPPPPVDEKDQAFIEAVKGKLMASVTESIAKAAGVPTAMVDPTVMRPPKITPPPEETPMTTTITPLPRSKGALPNVYALFAEREVRNSVGVRIEIRRALLAAQYVGSLTADETGLGRWTVEEHPDSGFARLAFAEFLGQDVYDVRALMCELTSGDVDRLRRKVMPSLIYPAIGVLESPESREEVPF